MKYFTINIFNNTNVLYHDKPMLLFKQRHHATTMIKSWFRNTPSHIHGHIFEIRQLEPQQLPTNRNILVLNQITDEVVDECRPFPVHGLDDYKQSLEETWKKL